MVAGAASADYGIFRLAFRSNTRSHGGEGLAPLSPLLF